MREKNRKLFVQKWLWHKAIAIVSILMSIVANLMGCYFQNEIKRKRKTNIELHSHPPISVAQKIYSCCVFVIAFFLFLFLVVIVIVIAIAVDVTVHIFSPSFPFRLCACVDDWAKEVIQSLNDTCL